ncbi:MAG: hypothetical protein PHH54_00685 [Candidatus Nanoarchaeia archaeon]|nr:hypothetical protein [Candidatus Nanoarchaeia archaeon]MDD5740478.1 hypothetical protein [Candidatus Nanoarchaeia archaeon]
MVIIPEPLIERKIRNDNETVKSLEIEIDKFLEATFNGTREVAFDLLDNTSREAIDKLIQIYSPHWKVYHFTGSQTDRCNRLIFSYGGKKNEH